MKLEIDICAAQSIHVCHGGIPISNDRAKSLAGERGKRQDKTPNVSEKIIGILHTEETRIIFYQECTFLFFHLRSEVSEPKWDSMTPGPYRTSSIISARHPDSKSPFDSAKRSDFGNGKCRGTVFVELDALKTATTKRGKPATIEGRTETFLFPSRHCLD